MKNKIDYTLVKQVKINFTTKESWLKVKTKPKDIKCENCGRLHVECNGEIAFAIVSVKGNAHLCQDCGQYFIDNGAQNVNISQNNYKLRKEKLIKQAKRIGIQFNGFWGYKESELDVDKLKDIIGRQIKQKRSKFHDFLNLKIEIKNTLFSFVDSYNVANPNYKITPFELYQNPDDIFSDYDKIIDRSSHRWLDYLTVQKKINNKTFIWGWATCNGDNSVFDQGFSFDFGSLKELKLEQLITDTERLN
jgi:hypothetical protein